MFGFWFWVLLSLAVLLVGAFIYDVYDRRRKGASTAFPKNAPAARGTEAPGAAAHHRNILNNTNTPGSL